MKKSAVILVSILSVLFGSNLFAENAYDANKVKITEQIDQQSLAKAQSAINSVDYVSAKKAFSRVLHANGILLNMQAPSGSQAEWKRLNQQVILAAMHGYEAAKHQDLTKLQNSLKELQTFVAQETATFQ